MLGQLYAYGGDMVRAAEHLEAARAIMQRHRDASSIGVHLNLTRALGVTHPHRGELENCVHHHNPSHRAGRTSAVMSIALGVGSWSLGID